MTLEQFRFRLTGQRQRLASITLSIAKIKERLGQPCDTRISPRWCKTTNRDLLVLTFDLNPGKAQVMGYSGFINGEQALLDGWVQIDTPSTLTDATGSASASALPAQTMRLPFTGNDDATTKADASTDTAPGPTTGRQMNLGDW
jgi:hypothetical protein